ncbi:hypothetical protein OROGR_007337 [Orobanche gracilis]
MDKDTPQSQPDLTQLQSQVLHDCEVQTVDISDNEDLESLFVTSADMDDDACGLDWDDIEVVVQNVEREHEKQSKDRSMEVPESDSGTDGGQDEDTKEDSIWSSDVELRSHCSDLEEEARELQPVFNELDLVDPKLELGMKFSSRALFKDAIYTHAVLTKKDLVITKNKVGRMHAKCKGSKKCKWKCHANKMKDEETYYVHSYDPIHNCNETNRVSALKSGWLSQRYKQKFISYPDISVKGFRDEITRELDVNFSKQKAYRARKKALDSINGDPIEQYGLLWDFIAEVKRTNPNSTLLLGVDEERRFQTMYVCLGALKQGWKDGCRPVIGVDGCHLMGPHKGVLLTAVGIDANNNIYPITWAVVGNECFDYWDWFLSVLKSDLHLVEQKEYTFISDKQKGLLQALDVHFKESEKRFCVRHLLGNFKRAGFTCEAYKSALWGAARASTVNSWDRKMEAMFNLDLMAVEWFKDKPPRQWSRSHFSTYPKCDILLNNGCESFNKAIKEARNMPILSMMDWLMEWSMKRLQQNRDHCKSKWKGKLCPKIKNELQKNMDKKRGSIAIMSNENYFRVETNTGERVFVNLQQWTCGCRKWDLSGIPCSHACAAIIALDKNPEDYVHNCYWVESYKKAYEPAVIPINGRLEWAKSGIQAPLTPNEGRTSGRPTERRRLEPDEQPNKDKRKCRGKTNRSFVIKPTQNEEATTDSKCGYCRIQGHNRAVCQKRKMDETRNPLELVGESSGDQGIHDIEVETQTIFGDANSMAKQQTVKSFSLMQSLRKDVNSNNESRDMSRPSAQPQTQPPSMFQQMQTQCQFRDMTQNLTIQGNTVHVRQTSGRTMSRSQLEAAKRSKLKSMIKRSKAKNRDKLSLLH